MNEEWFGDALRAAGSAHGGTGRLLRALFAGASGFGFRFDGDVLRPKIPVYRRPGAARRDLPIWVAGVNRYMMRAAGASPTRWWAIRSPPAAGTAK